MSISNLDEMENKIKELIAYKGPVIFEVMTPSNQLLIPRVASKKLDDGKIISMPYDDMFPFLPREEYEKNIHVDF
jgi:acetolactate synthase-1/2/3 large subunit